MLASFLLSLLNTSIKTTKMENELKITMVKGKGGFSVVCKNRQHYLKIRERFRAKGYKQVPNVTPEPKNEDLPF